MSSRGRGISNTPAWMTKDREMDKSFDTGGGPRGGGPISRGGDDYQQRNATPTTTTTTSHHHHHHQQQQPPPRRYDPRNDRRHDRDFDDRRNRGGGGRSSRRRPTSNRAGIFFQSYEEERAWLEERRRKRHERKSLFDVTPTADQLALEELQKAALASSGPNPSVFLRPEEMKAKQMVMAPNIDISSLQPQQTRHARRVYVGNLADELTESQIHDFFRSSINTAMGEDEKTSEDPIASVYINRDKKFAFIEFYSIDMCTACISLDGINVCGKGVVKIKRPNDFNPSLVPTSPNSDILRKFDPSKLGIISTNVQDSPNKIFIGGLPYHLTDSEVLELLKAFGSVKAFNLVKADMNSTSSKGYCFVEYVDENVKDIAVMGLNGMDIGHGKQLSAKIATPTQNTQHTGMSGVSSLVPSMGMYPIGESSAPPIMKIVDGIDIQALVDVAMGVSNQSNISSTGTGVLDIANAALSAAYGQGH